MENVERLLKKLIINELVPNRVTLLLGARRVGKTFLIKEIRREYEGKSLFLNAEESMVSEMLRERNSHTYLQMMGDADLLIIDEAQSISDIGRILKLMVDELPGIKVIATGSSGFDLLNKTGEPLTGRVKFYQMHPFSQSELSLQENLLETRQRLEERLIYGCYPEVFISDSPEEKREYLHTLISTYLLKDILILEGIKNSNKLFDLLKLIAFQLGSEVSYQELSRNLGMSKTTVEKYLDLLSKVFIIHNLRGYSRNLRKEVTQSCKWYFWDNGVRNAIISNFSPLSLRQDIGVLWENYCISERIKFNHYRKFLVNSYFWRTYDQQEIDYIEERDSNLTATEIKWKNPNHKTPKAWKENYPEAGFQVIHQGNYLDWIT
ncbi:MAG: ATP-binding protein [Bacteroidetes bacterium]|nr:ATP-binding protein [Bacteroidota bacterium]